MNCLKPDSISLCMVVKNEEKLIGQCLRNMRAVVNEMVVIDTGSTDNTINIAKKYGAHVIRYRWDGSLGRARNEYLKNAVSPWILVLDADERIAKKDLPKLKKMVNDDSALGYVFDRRDYTKTYDLMRQWRPNDGRYPAEEKFSRCPGWSLTSYIRLFRRKEGIRYDEGYSAHTDFSESLKRHKGKIKKCDIIMHHFQFLKGDDFIIKKQKDRLKYEIQHIRMFPNNAWSYLNIGITFFSLGNDANAVKYLKKAVKINPKFDMAYFVLGMVYKEALRYDDSICALKKAIRMDPKNADAWAVLGMVYDCKNLLSDAEDALRKAVTINPFHLLAHNSLGIVYEEQGKFKDAEKEYKKAIRIHPQYPNVRNNLKDLYRRTDL